MLMHRSIISSRLLRPNQRFFLRGGAGWGGVGGRFSPEAAPAAAAERFCAAKASPALALALALASALVARRACGRFGPPGCGGVVGGGGDSDDGCGKGRRANTSSPAAPKSINPPPEMPPEM